MKIYLIRHAEAIDYETDTVKDDEYRYITPNGRITTAKVARTLMEKLKKLDKIFTSPLVRAVQTAEIAANELKFKKDVELVNELKNESSIASLQLLLEKNSELKSIALVGHEPKMSLIVKSLSDKKDLKDFGKSSVCLINFNIETGEGNFEWYFNSKKMEFES